MKNLILSLVGASCLALVGSAREIGYDTLIAHRGESHDAPENTLPAYKLAVSRGFGFECDIYMSKDGQLFTFHDHTLTRTTGGAHNEKCTEASWKDTISKVNVGGWGKWKGSKFDPTRPATFEEVLSLARDGRYIYIEVKGGNAAWVAAIKKALAAQTTATPKNVLFITFTVSTAALLRQELPEYQTYQLLSARKGRSGPDGKPAPFLTADEVLAVLAKSHASGLDMQFDAACHDAAFVKRIHDAGYSCHFWTIDDLKNVRKAFAVGADSVTTDVPQKILLEDRKSAK